jgi:hypothetical protein
MNIPTGVLRTTTLYRPSDVDSLLSMMALTTAPNRTVAMNIDNNKYSNKSNHNTSNSGGVATMDATAANDSSRGMRRTSKSGESDRSNSRERYRKKIDPSPSLSSSSATRRLSKGETPPEPKPTDDSVGKNGSSTRLSLSKKPSAKKNLGVKKKTTTMTTTGSVSSGGGNTSSGSDDELLLSPLATAKKKVRPTDERYKRRDRMSSSLANLNHNHNNNSDDGDDDPRSKGAVKRSQSHDALSKVKSDKKKSNNNKKTVSSASSKKQQLASTPTSTPARPKRTLFPLDPSRPIPPEQQVMIQTIQNDMTHMEQEAVTLEQHLRDQASSFLQEAKAIKEKRKTDQLEQLKAMGPSQISTVRIDLLVHHFKFDVSTLADHFKDEMTKLNNKIASDEKDKNNLEVNVQKLITLNEQSESAVTDAVRAKHQIIVNHQKYLHLYQNAEANLRSAEQLVQQRNAQRLDEIHNRDTYKDCLKAVIRKVQLKFKSNNNNSSSLVSQVLTIASKSLERELKLNSNGDSNHTNNNNDTGNRSDSDDSDDDYNGFRTASAAARKKRDETAASAAAAASQEKVDQETIGGDNTSVSSASSVEISDVDDD